VPRRCFGPAFEDVTAREKAASAVPVPRQVVPLAAAAAAGAAGAVGGENEVDRKRHAEEASASAKRTHA
jgi:hypothetical protein